MNLPGIHTPASHFYEASSIAPLHLRPCGTAAMQPLVTSPIPAACNARLRPVPACAHPQCCDHLQTRSGWLCLRASDSRLETERRRQDWPVSEESWRDRQDAGTRKLKERQRETQSHTRRASQRQKLRQGNKGKEKQIQRVKERRKKNERKGGRDKGSQGKKGWGGKRAGRGGGGAAWSGLGGP